MNEDIKSINDLSSSAEGGNELASSSGKEENSSPDPSKNLFKCRSCGYVYDPDEGVKKFGISKGTPFLSLDQKTFKCPVCLLGVEYFQDIGSKFKPSGFNENLSYGFGLNNLTEGQKNVLIFGGLAFAFACFLSLYSLH